jgi:pimeloyl-ACP methyl ester carboxylesterase
MDKVMVETSRIRTHCFVGGPGDGEPVLLVHGNLTTGRFWQDVTDGFPGGYRLVAPDLRAFGRTERKPVDATRAGPAAGGSTSPAGPTAAGWCSSTPSTTPRSWPA